MDQAIQEVMELFAREVIQRRQGFGGWFHLINHTAALQSLHHMGWESQCQLGLKTLQQHLEYYLALPDLTDELGSLQRALCRSKTQRLLAGILPAVLSVVRLVDPPDQNHARFLPAPGKPQ